MLSKLTSASAPTATLAAIFSIFANCIMLLFVSFDKAPMADLTELVIGTPRPTRMHRSLSFVARVAKNPYFIHNPPKGEGKAQSCQNARFRQAHTAGELLSARRRKPKRGLYMLRRHWLSLL